MLQMQWKVQWSVIIFIYFQSGVLDYKIQNHHKAAWFPEKHFDTGQFSNTKAFFYVQWGEKTPWPVCISWRVITPPNLTLGPDCGESCIVVNGRCIEKHSLTQQIYFAWLLMQKCLQKMKDHTSESRFTTDLFFLFFYLPLFVPQILFGKGSCSQCNWSLISYICFGFSVSACISH